ncbi:50S ribosomal protein L11 methyltransferase [Niabella soli]|uniref:Ribosomal protein L11 methyltransferase n=1 Tax=Niabella soli DSM 19437 TaxID=929713 RepID=W0EWZ9_9BACT|nr:50S ribosomal protein L11 methyltransferase [Niabella soli]AHF15350.1 ribosomal protein L11 methyltransferase [Niabella soli DSM 19437]
MELNEKYTEVVFTNVTAARADLLIAALAEKADGFEEGELTVTAFFSSNKIDNETLDHLAKELELRYEVKELAAQNWNALWESNFEPVLVDDFVAVRASFHPPFPAAQHEVLINPKMSFGTGHHATTWLMMQQMQTIDFKNKSVFDFGTGTGILAILAKKLGAASIRATDLDEWSIANAKENFEINDAAGIELILSDSANQQRTFDVILANINKNILLATIPQLKAQLTPGGTLLLSGLLASDEVEMTTFVKAAGLILTNTIVKNNWLCIRCYAQK